MKVVYMAALAATIILCLGFLYSASHAQGTPDLPLQQWSVSVTSTNCVAGTICGNGCPAGCQSVTFQVPTTGQYNLYASVKCSGTHCGHCQSCANLYQGNTHLRHVASHCGDTDPCTGELDGFNLTADVTYTLCVCLFPCPSETIECTTCGNYGCEAVACVTTTFGGGGCD